MYGIIWSDAARSFSPLASLKNCFGHNCTLAGPQQWKRTHFSLADSASAAAADDDNNIILLGELVSFVFFPQVVLNGIQYYVYPGIHILCYTKRLLLSLRVYVYRHSV